MSAITHETRAESAKKVEKTKENRKTLILSILGDKEMTAFEVAEKLFAMGAIKILDPNAARPRLTELEKDEIVETVRKVRCPMSGRTVAVYKRIV